MTKFLKCPQACTKGMPLLGAQLFFLFVFFFNSFATQAQTTCPSLGFFDSPETFCEDFQFSLAVSNIQNHRAVDNGEADFDINFVYLPAGSTADPYTDGVVFASETPGFSSVDVYDIGDDIPPGNYDIYAILHPAPADASCRPSLSNTLTITPCEDLGNFCFIDFDNNGIYDGDDVPLPGVVVTIYDATTDTELDQLLPTTSGADGQYWFDPAPAGELFLSFNPPGTTYLAATNPGLNTDNTNSLDPTQANGPLTTADFTFTALAPALTFDAAFIGPGVVAGKVWPDNNFDLLDDEVATAAVTLELEWWGTDGVWDNTDDVLLSQQTTATGEYTFEHLPAGEYRLNVSSVAGTVLAQGYDLVSPANLPFEFTVDAGQIDHSNTHFIYQPQCLPSTGVLSTTDALVLCGNADLGIYEDQEVSVALNSFVTPLSVAADYEYRILVVNEAGAIVQSHLINTPQSAANTLVDITAMPVGDYGIHGVHYLTTDPDVVTSPFDFSIGASFAAIHERLTNNDGTTNPILLADVCGDVSLTQNFVQLSMEPQPPVFLACIGSLNISLDAACAANVTPQMVLTGNWGCLRPHDFQIDIFDSETGQLVSDEGLITGCGTYEYRINLLLDGIGGFPCWGVINARDNHAPVVDCVADVDMSTNDLGQRPFYCSDISELLFQEPVSYTVNSDGSFAQIDQAIKDILDVTGYPSVQDACSVTRVYVSDVLTEDGNCGDKKITRTFFTQDNEGGVCANNANYGELCVQEINFTRPGIADLELPQEVIELPCADFGDTANPTPDQIQEALGIHGYPAIFAFFDADPATATFDPYYINQSYCNLGASYSDLPRINHCGNGYLFIREWYIVDKCNLSETLVHRQNIRITDNVDPTLVLPTVDYDMDGLFDVRRYSTSPFNCMANILVPNPVALEDACSGPPTVSITVIDVDDNTVFIGTLGNIFTVPIGTYTIRYCAEDACGNETCQDMPIIVSDEIEPSVACDDALTVQIGGGNSAENILGIARVFSEDIDEGSNDNCTAELDIQVRRNYWDDNDCSLSMNSYSPWGDYVDLYCCDIGTDVTVELRVRDEAGNENICSTVVTTEDKLRPICFAPANQTVSCVDLPNLVPADLQEAYNTDFETTSMLMNEVFGAPTGTDNCGVDTVVERSPLISINDCGWGSIQRRFKAWQWNGDLNGNGQIDGNEYLESTNNCTQIITITESHHYRILFPADASADCSDPQIPSIESELLACDQLAINEGDPVRFATAGDECYKLSITYDVINWCLWDGEADAYVIGRMTDTDDLEVDACERPILESIDGVSTIDRNHNEPSCNSSLSNAFVVDAAQDVGRWSYTQFVKVYDNAIPTITVAAYGGASALCNDLPANTFGSVDNENCNAAISIPFSVADDCEVFNGAGDLVLELTSAWLDFSAQDLNNNQTIESNEFEEELDVLSNITHTSGLDFLFEIEAPIIASSLLADHWHTLRLELRDACGNVTSQYVPFQVVDCKAPAPICLSGLSVTVQPAVEGGCEAVIWASDILASGVDDCSGPVEYAIYASDAVGPELVPSALDTGLVIPWNDEASLDVNLYAIDQYGNHDYCQTTVSLQPSIACVALGAIGGIILTEEDEAVGNVLLSISGLMPMTVMSENDGTYLFEDLDEGVDYTITASREDNHGNGVSVLDIVKISKHILGTELLDSPYKMIAADVNKSQHITTLDLIQIRKVILNIYDEFPQNNSWRFIDRDYEFPVENNPWFQFFPELININDLVGQELQTGFVAVKIGDVNASATP